MKTGGYFSVPESPDDVNALWTKSLPLSGDLVPKWLDQQHAGLYRLLPARRDNGEIDAGIYATNLQELQNVGCIVEPADHPTAARVYLPKLAWGHEWAIGIYSGESLFSLIPAPQARNPVLTRDNVTDVMASFVADPFLVRDRRSWCLFFEVMNWRANKGQIAVATSEDGYEWRYRQIVLDEPFHLSFPYVFTWRDEFFMIPESHQAGAVRLYRAVRFPWEWRFAGTLIEAAYAVDATVFQHEGLWWMMVAGGQPDEHDTLRLYCSDNLEGRWQEHPSSPVVRDDPRRARPGGRVIQYEGGLLRFGQDCLPDYGTALRAFAVTQLSRETYSEREAAAPFLGPSGSGWNALGMHHLDAHQLPDGSWLAAVDGR